MADTAAKALSELGSVTADALRKLGKKGKLDRPRTDPKVALTKSATMAKALQDDIKKLVKSLHDYQTTLSDVEGDCYDYRQLVAGSDFKLSKANPDEERIINAVSYTLTKCLDDIALGSKSPRRVAAKFLAVLEAGDDIAAF